MAAGIAACPEDTMTTTKADAHPGRGRAAVLSLLAGAVLAVACSANNNKAQQPSPTLTASQIAAARSAIAAACPPGQVLTNRGACVTTSPASPTPAATAVTPRAAATQAPATAQASPTAQAAATAAIATAPLAAGSSATTPNGLQLTLGAIMDPSDVPDQYHPLPAGMRWVKVLGLAELLALMMNERMRSFAAIRSVSGTETPSFIDIGQIGQQVRRLGITIIPYRAVYTTRTDDGAGNVVDTSHPILPKNKVIFLPTDAVGYCGTVPQSLNQWGTGKYTWADTPDNNPQHPCVRGGEESPHDRYGQLLERQTRQVPTLAGVPLRERAPVAHAVTRKIYRRQCIPG
jgi:hypothetical protein